MEKSVLLCAISPSALTDAEPKPLAAVLNDIGTEELAHLEMAFHHGSPAYP